MLAAVAVLVVKDQELLWKEAQVDQAVAVAVQVLYQELEEQVILPL